MSSGDGVLTLFPLRRASGILYAIITVNEINICFVLPPKQGQPYYIRNVNEWVSAQLLNTTTGKNNSRTILVDKKYSIITDTFTNSNKSTRQQIYK